MAPPQAPLTEEIPGPTGHQRQQPNPTKAEDKPPRPLRTGGFTAGTGFEETFPDLEY